MVEWKKGQTFLQGYILRIMGASNIEKSKIFTGQNMYQLVLLKKGTVILSMGGQKIIISAPSVICLNDQDDLVWENVRSEYELNVIYFHPSVVNRLFTCDNLMESNLTEEWTDSIIQDRTLLLPFFERKVPYGGCLSVEIDTFNRLLQLADRMQFSMNNEVDDLWPCRTRSYLIEMLIILQMRYIDHTAPKEFFILNDTQKEMDLVLDYIHSNYSTKITIDQLTKQFNMNRNSLNENFTELTGCSPIAYIIQHRLKVAESLLVNTQMPVHEICERVGFSELSNFMKSFKKKYGKTPANYRMLYSRMTCY